MTDITYAPQAQIPPEEAHHVHKKDRFVSQETGFRNVVWAVLFLLSIGGLIALAAVYGDRFNESGRADEGPMDRVLRNYFGIMAMAAGIGGLMSVIGLLLCRTMGAKAVRILWATAVLSLIAGGVVTIVYEALVPGIILLAVAGLVLLSYPYISRRMPFSTASMGAAAHALRDHSFPVVLGIALTFVTMAYWVLWMFTILSLASETRFYSPSLGRLWLALSVLQFYWFSHVMGDLGAATAAGTVAAWWFVPDVSNPSGPAFRRAASYSFGSICYGAPFLPVARFVHVLARALARIPVIGACFAPIAATAEGYIEYYNFYGYSQVAMYGKSFNRASRDTWLLLKSRGFDSLVDLDLSYTATILTCLTAVGLTTVGGSIWQDRVTTERWYVWILAAMFTAHWIAQVGMSTFQGAVAGVFASWAEDPNTMSISRPAQYNRLAAAAQQEGAHI